MSKNQDEYNYIPPDATPLMHILIRLLDETIDEEQIYNDVTTILETDDVNKTIEMDGQNLDALMIALFAKSKEVVQLLLKAGAAVKDYHLQYMENARMEGTELYTLLKNYKKQQSLQQGGRRRNQSHRRRKNKKHSRRHGKK